MSKSEIYIRFVETVLANRNLDSTDTTWQQSPVFLRFVASSADIDTINSLSMGLFSEEEIFIITKISNHTVYHAERIQTSILQEIDHVRGITEETSQTVKTINLLFFISDIETRVNISNTFTTKELRNFRQKIRQKIRGIKLLYSSYLYKEISEKELKLPNIRRYEMLQVPPTELSFTAPPNIEYLKGLVFTANVFDLVELYNQVGDQLFQKNVRLGIEDTLEVDQSIQTTLETSPETFWFKNNGITLLVDEPSIRLDRVNEILLKPRGETSLPFSVINGAQTISASAEFFYRLSQEERKKKAAKAKVLVRIIQLHYHDASQSKEQAKNISIALNRQKPIKSEDIAYTNQFVETFNEYLSANEQYRLVRRGEETYSGQKNYSLIEFARAAKACSGAPGAARTMSAKALLKINSKNEHFHDERIFVPEWYENDADHRTLFLKHYAPIPFALSIADQYLSATKGIPFENEQQKIVVKNSMWHFIAYTIYVLNDFQAEDYSNFRFSSLNTEEIRALIPLFADVFAQIILENDLNLDSNLFKNEHGYDKLKQSPKKSSAFLHKLYAIAGMEDAVSSVSDGQRSDTLPFTVQMPNLPPQSFKFASQAFVSIIRNCLQEESRFTIDTAVALCRFLTYDKNDNVGVMAQKEAIQVGNRTIYIGKNTSTQEKLHHLRQFLDSIKQPLHTILLLKNNQVIFSY